MVIGIGKNLVTCLDLGQAVVGIIAELRLGFLAISQLCTGQPISSQVIGIAETSQFLTILIRDSHRRQLTETVIAVGLD